MSLSASLAAKPASHSRGNRLGPRRAGPGAVLFLLYAALAGSALTGSVLADAPRLDADKVMHVKGAFLYAFSKFITWPNTDGAEHFNLCVADQPSLAEILTATTRDRQVKGRGVRIQQVSGDGDTDTCDMLYLAGQDGEALQTYLDAVRELPVLTIGDAPDFLERGGMIRFLVENEQLRFEIENTAARRVDIDISSELLGLGRVR